MISEDLPARGSSERFGFSLYARAVEGISDFFGRSDFLESTPARRFSVGFIIEIRYRSYRGRMPYYSQSRIRENRSTDDPTGLRTQRVS